MLQEVYTYLESGVNMAVLATLGAALASAASSGDGGLDTSTFYAPINTPIIVGSQSADVFQWISGLTGGNTGNMDTTVSGTVTNAGMSVQNLTSSNLMLYLALGGALLLILVKGRR